MYYLSKIQLIKGSVVRIVTLSRIILRNSATLLIFFIMAGCIERQVLKKEPQEVVGIESTEYAGLSAFKFMDQLSGYSNFYYAYELYTNCGAQVQVKSVVRKRAWREFKYWANPEILDNHGRRPTVSFTETLGTSPAPQADAALFIFPDIMNFKFSPNVSLYAYDTKLNRILYYHSNANIVALREKFVNSGCVQATFAP